MNHRDHFSRRQFIKGMGALSGMAMLHSTETFSQTMNTFYSAIRIKQVNSSFEREPLIRPFGFKGGYLTEIWQSIAQMESETGHSTIGLGTQSVLWSDSKVFAAHSESGGNALMYALTERALQMAKEIPFESPIDLLDSILDEVYDYGKKITNNPNLRKTFALNALVAFDKAAWLLYARENGIKNFDEMIPAKYKPGLAHHHEKVASVPSIAYTIPMSELKEEADRGHFIMKIKMGMPGTQQEMLEKDKERLTQIHNTIGSRETPHTSDGKIPYYLDMNGRYEEKETLLRLVDHAEKIGMLPQILVVEEPFPEELDVHVDDVGVRVIADESAHTDKDAEERIQMGYRGIALKAIAKTLSMTLKIAQLAHEQNIPCLCADLTVNPILIDWNKNVTARLAPFPGLDFNLMETNGHQNYKHWDAMCSYHPHNGASWTQTQDGVFVLGPDFYKESGGIFQLSEHYKNLVAPPDFYK